MSERPTGTVTFLFTDIEGSTRLWEEQPEAMQAALAQHDALLRAAVEAHHGHIVKTTGDGCHAAFAVPTDALNAGLAAQRNLQASNSQLHLKIRMALHTGEAEARGGDYYGPAVNRAARLMSVASGGQVLISAPTADLVRDNLRADVALRDLGEHRLRDLIRPERIFQAVTPDLPTDFPPLKSLNTFPNNLPVQLTSFVGREKEIAEVKHLLTSTRLLTLIGPGGTGKTRLALQAAADVLSDFAEGVWLIELAPLADAAHLLPAIASVFGLREVPGRPISMMVVDYLRDKSLLLLLDNCEHLVEACARLADEWLHVCPRLKIVASSREALGIAGEVVYRVPPLSLPDAEQTDRASTRAEAVRLFAERAAAHTQFELNENNIRAVSKICRRLDGIPLAIELAAARVRVFSVEQIAARLDDRFRLLVGGSRTALPRQQTLRALIDWSYDLLPEDERKLLRCLSVFVAGWTFEAAEAVGVGLDVLGLLTQLVNKSLVLVDEAGLEVRYRFLETIRQYARDKLFEAREAADARDRHLDYFLQFAADIEPELEGRQALPALKQLKTELDNFRAALEWAQEHNPEVALRLLTSIGNLGRIGYASEGRRQLGDIMPRFEALPPVEGEAARQRLVLRAKGLWVAGTLAMGQGENNAARPMLEESVRLAREIGEHKILANALGILAFAASFQGDVETAAAVIEEGRRLCQNLNYRWGLAMFISGQATLARVRGDAATAQRHVEEALGLVREVGNPWLTAMFIMGMVMLAAALNNHAEAQMRLKESGALFRDMDDRHFVNVIQSELAHIERRLGHYTQAVAMYTETLSAWKDMGHRAAVAHELECFAFIAGAQEQTERAVKLLSAADSLREACNSPMTAGERLEYDQAVTQIRAQLNEVTYATAWDEGRTMTMEQAIQFALMDSDE
ncbi:MAG: ATP-binding protein [Anaerolineales bacterium]